MGQEVQVFDADYWREQSKQSALSEPAGFSARLTVRSGMLLFDGEPLPGNQCVAVVVDTLRENDYYDPKVPYDPENPVSPICYALSRDGEQMAPHPSMQDDLNYFKFQTATCAACAWNKYGTATRRDGTPGKGKACQNRRRLHVIAAATLENNSWRVFEDEGYYRTADMHSLKLPVTSVALWSDYVNKRLPAITGNPSRPYWAVATRIYVEQHVTYQFQVKYDLFGILPDSIYAAVLSRRELFAQQPVEGYKAPRSAQDPFS